MHKIQEKEFVLEDFSTDQLLSPYGNHNDERDIPFVMTSDENQYSPYGIVECIIIPMLNKCRDEYNRLTKRLKDDKTLTESESKHLKAKQKVMWWQMIQLLPSSYNQTRNVMLNYETLANIYKSRKNHKLDEWREFCKWIEELPCSELIVGNTSENKED